MTFNLNKHFYSLTKLMAKIATTKKKMHVTLAVKNNEAMIGKWPYLQTPRGVCTSSYFLIINITGSDSMMHLIPISPPSPNLVSLDSIGPSTSPPSVEISLVTSRSNQIRKDGK